MNKNNKYLDAKSSFSTSHDVQLCLRELNERSLQSIKKHHSFNFALSVVNKMSPFLQRVIDCEFWFRRKFLILSMFLGPNRKSSLDPSDEGGLDENRIDTSVTFEGIIKVITSVHFKISNLFDFKAKR
jgi:hypothetical protein